ncbi:MAG: hypothetical protein HQL67_06505 [Magnetococcales bacterium]|nr:hypothetical protein [Magnetococcales bacterium]
MFRFLLPNRIFGKQARQRSKIIKFIPLSLLVGVGITVQGCVLVAMAAFGGLTAMEVERAGNRQKLFVDHGNYYDVTIKTPVVVDLKTNQRSLNALYLINMSGDIPFVYGNIRVPAKTAVNLLASPYRDLVLDSSATDDSALEDFAVIQSLLTNPEWKVERAKFNPMLYVIKRNVDDYDEKLLQTDGKNYVVTLRVEADWKGNDGSLKDPAVQSFYLLNDSKIHTISLPEGWDELSPGSGVNLFYNKSGSHHFDPAPIVKSISENNLSIRLFSENPTIWIVQDMTRSGE